MRHFFIFIVVLCLSSLVIAQSASQIVYRGDRSYNFIERTDLRRYDNNRYVGLVSREVSSFITPVDTLYEGSFFVTQDTVRSAKKVTSGIHDAIPATFRIDSHGQLSMIEDHGYPSFRSFPSFTKDRIHIGDTWQAKAERAVDPLDKGIVTKMPMLVQYTYVKDDYFNGEPVYVLQAQWATRYGTLYRDFGGDKALINAQGSHKASIIVSKRNGCALVVHDSVDEYFEYNDGNKVAFKGTISLFTEYPPAIDRSGVIRALQRIASISDEQAHDLAVKPEILASAQQGSHSTSTEHGTQTAIDQNWPMPQGTQQNSVSEKIDDSITNPQKLHNTSKTEPVSVSDLPAIEVENTAAGIKLTLPNLQFKPDSAELISGESKRLDQIAEVLKAVSGAQLLVEGHTASVGNPKGEQQLSEDRARAVADALIKRGIPANAFICKGSGGRKPVGDNRTDVGKARNRRVEITILE